MGRLTVAKYKTTYFTTGGTFSIDVEGNADIDEVMENATQTGLRADYVVLASPTAPESGEPKQRTIIIREHIVALAIEEELEQ